MDGMQLRDGGVDPWEFHGRWPVRLYELDSNGHVNNAVYLNYVEQVALEHVEAMGFGRDWYIAKGGGWFVREHHATYHRPATFGDFLLLTTIPLRMGAATGERYTTIHRESDGDLLTEVRTLWAWVREDGRPGRIPEELRSLFRRGPPPDSSAAGITDGRRRDRGRTPETAAR
jgi:acyl-CoA thioester hydrolase